MPATRDVHDTTLDRASPARWLGALRIRGQVTLALGIALFLLLAVGGRLLLTLRETTRSLEWLASNRFPASQALLGYESAAVAMQGALNGLLNHQADGDDRKAAYAEVEDAQRRAEAARAAFEALPQDEDLLDPWRSASALWEDWKKGVAVVVDKQRQRDALLAQGPAGGPRVAELDREAAQAVAAVRGTRQRLTDAVGTLVDYTKVGADAEAEVANRRARVATWTMSGVVAAALAALALLALLIARNVKRQLDAIAAEAARVSAAVADGRLDVRGDPATVNAEFRPIVLGLNAAVEAFVAPVRTVAASMARVAEGDLPPPIDAPWKGELEALEHSVNGCVAAVGAVVSDVDALAHAALEGRLAERADAGRHRGHFRRIVERLDATLDAVTAPVEEASQVLEELARRDLLARVEGDYRGDHARVKAAVNATAEALHGALAQVAGAVAQVSVASSQIASSSQAVAQGASEQASSLEETTSALEEMAAQTRQTADNAAQADAMARSARGTAEEGGAAVAHMTGTMEKIRSAAEGTSQIIKEVNEIAFQTNLLALNAAVEAARAGDAGRGFAVVADEVRALALRSKQAASRTEELIRQSVLQATEGEATSREVAERFTRIAGAVGQVTALVAEIAAAAREQAQGLEHLNGAMSEMDKVTQQNAASSEESSSAAAELSGRAEELAGLVGGFRLGRLAAGGALDRLDAAPAGAGASGPATQARA